MRNSLLVCGVLVGTTLALDATQIDKKRDSALCSAYGISKQLIISRFSDDDLSQKRLTGVGLIPKTQWVMIGTYNSGIRILNSQNMKSSYLAEGDHELQSPITSLAGASCMSRVAFTTTKYVFVGTITPFALTYEYNLGGCTLKSIVNSIAFDPTDSTVAGGCEDGSVQLWDIERTEPIVSLSEPRLASSQHTAPIFALGFLDKQTLCYNSPSRGITIHDLRSKEKTILEDQHTGFVRALAASIVHRFIVSGGGDGIVRLYDVRKPKVIYESFPTKSDAPITSLAFCPPFQEFLVGQENGACSLRRANNKIIGYGSESVHAATISAIATSDLTTDYFAVSVGWDGAINFYGPKSMSLEEPSTKDSDKKEEGKNK